MNPTLRSYFWRRYVVVFLVSLLIGTMVGIKAASLALGILVYILSMLALTFVLIIYMMSNFASHWHD